MDETSARQNWRVLNLPLAGFVVGITADRRWEEQVSLLRRAGADVLHGPSVCSSPFSADSIGALPDDVLPAQRLVRRLIGGGVHAVTFTSGAAVRNLVKLAADDGVVDPLLEALNRVPAACISETCAVEAQLAGVDSPLLADRPGLGSLLRVLVEVLSFSRLQLVAGGQPLTLAGCSVSLGEQRCELSEVEAGVLRTLAARVGAVVSKEELLTAVWSIDADPHLTEVAISRLRRRLGTWGKIIRTVPRRGYVLDAEKR